MVCLSGFELYSRWVPLKVVLMKTGGNIGVNVDQQLIGAKIYSL